VYRFRSRQDSLCYVVVNVIDLCTYCIPSVSALRCHIYLTTVILTDYTIQSVSLHFKISSDTHQFRDIFYKAVVVVYQDLM
jgi:hypothetical protein